MAGFNKYVRILEQPAVYPLQVKKPQKKINIANDGKMNLSDAKEYWLSKLLHRPKRFGDEELADMLEEIGWFISDFQKAFNELISKGKVKRRQSVFGLSLS